MLEYVAVAGQPLRNELQTPPHVSRRRRYAMVEGTLGSELSLFDAMIWFFMQFLSEAFRTSGP